MLRVKFQRKSNILEITLISSSVSETTQSFQQFKIVKKNMSELKKVRDEARRFREKHGLTSKELSLRQSARDIESQLAKLKKQYGKTNRTSGKKKKITKRRVFPLTVKMIYDDYWDHEKDEGKPIRAYVGQVYDGKGANDQSLTTESEELVKETIIPGKYMIHEWGKSIYPSGTGPILPQHSEIFENWVSNVKLKHGPYMKSDKGKSRDDFYYMPFDVLDENTGDTRYVKLQICSGPLNSIASNCMGEVGYFVTR